MPFYRSADTITHLHNGLHHHADGEERRRGKRGRAGQEEGDTVMGKGRGERKINEKQE